MPGDTTPGGARVTDAESIGADLLGTSGEEGSVNRSLIKALGNSGLLADVFDPEGVTATALCAIRQGLARSNTGAETAFAIQGLGGVPIHLNGTQEIRDRWIPPITSGDAVAAFALTEPDAGSDAGALMLAAESDGDGFRLSGEKTYISNAPEADVYTVFGRTSTDAGTRGVTAFAVPGDSDGLTGEPIQMLSAHPIGRLHFDGVYVDRSSILGDVDKGFGVAMETLDLFRPSVGAFAVGMAEAAFREAVSHASDREAFGKRLSEFQGITHQIADVRVAIEAATHLIYAAAAAYDRGDKSSLTGLAAMAKLYATESAQRAVDVAIQVLGARGLETSSLLAHLYLDVRAPRIYEGTSEIQRNIIAREIFRGNL